MFSTFPVQCKNFFSVTDIVYIMCFKGQSKVVVKENPLSTLLLRLRPTFAVCKSNFLLTLVLGYINCKKIPLLPTFLHPWHKGWVYELYIMLICSIHPPPLLYRRVRAPTKWINIALWLSISYGDIQEGIFNLSLFRTIPNRPRELHTDDCIRQKPLTTPPHQL